MRTYILLLTAAAMVAGAADTASVNLFQAVRNNDLAAIQSAIAKGADANVRDRRGATPLMLAAAYGTPDAMKLLLDAGADVNAKSSFDATALLWAAGDAAKVRLLVERGANVNATSKLGRTPLIAAAAHDGASGVVRLLIEKGAGIQAADSLGLTPLHSASLANDLETVKLLVEKGADVNRADLSGGTALMNAASFGNLSAIDYLLARGANVNAASTFGGTVKNGDLGLKQLTSLMYAVPHGTPPLARALLKAGAKVNATDVRGMTPLMLAVSSDRQDLEMVRTLLAAGADVNVKSRAGETALDWARKFNTRPLIAALEKAGAQGSPFTPPEARKGAPPDARAALERSVPLLQKTAAEFFRMSGCAGCHHQNMIAVAVGAARRAGVRVDESADQEMTRAVKGQWAVLQEGLLQRLDPVLGLSDLQTFSLFGFAAGNVPADEIIDAIVASVAALQLRDGDWRLEGLARPPMEEGTIARTSMAVRMLQVYSIPGRKADFDARIARARTWLMQVRPRTTDDLVWHLAGLHWSGAGASMVRKAAGALRNKQSADGGWGPTPNLSSDAYATGTALWVLNESGSLKPSDASYQRGVRFLLNTQFEDGSWYVRSRSPKFQPYFESGFPFGHDQWISASATAWAVAALAPAVGGGVKRAGL